jgi:hypothetical protein
MEAVREKIGQLDCSSYGPFELIWTDGVMIERFISATAEFLSCHDHDALCFSSSSYEGKRVKALRAEAFDAWVKEGKMFDRLLPSFHLTQIDNDPAIGPLMKRPGRSTRSITQVDLNEDPASILRYWPHPTMSAGHPGFEGGV